MTKIPPGPVPMEYDTDQTEEQLLIAILEYCKYNDMFVYSPSFRGRTWARRALKKVIDLATIRRREILKEYKEHAKKPRTDLQRPLRW